MPKNKKEVKQVKLWALSYLEDSNLFVISFDGSIFVLQPSQLADFISQGQTVFNSVVAKKSFDAIQSFFNPQKSKTIEVPKIKPLNPKDREAAVLEVERMIKEYGNGKNSSSR